MVEEALLRALEAGLGRGACGRRISFPRGVVDAGRSQRRFEIVVDRPKRTRIGVVDFDLGRGERVFEHVILHAVEAEGAGRIEPKRLEITGNHLHGRDTAGFHRRNEALTAWEGVFGALPPEPQPRGIGQVVHARGTRGRDVEDASAGCCQLQPQASKALLRGFDPPALLGPCRVLHGMGLIKGQYAFKVFAHPVEDLAQSRGAAFARGPQRGVGDEEDTVTHRDGLVRFPFGERLNVGRRAAEIGPVADGVLDERGGFGDPDRLSAPGQPVHENEPRAFAPLAATGAVAEEIAKAIGTCIRVIIGARQLGLVVIDREPTRQVAPMGVMRHDDGFQLRLGEMPLLDQLGRQAQFRTGRA